MNYGLYLSASGVLTSMYRQDVFANNLANVETVGFKPDVPTVRQRDPESIEDGFSGELSHELLDRLGGGVLAHQQRISFQAGPLKLTENPLDLALESENTFFAVRAADPQTGAAAVRLTRDGRFTRDAQGYLVTMTAGQQVLDAEDQPIQLPGNGEVAIDTGGRIWQGGEEVAQLQITAVTDPQLLRKQGTNLFAWDGADDPRRPAPRVAVRQGYVESSGVDPVKALMDLVDATKAVTNNSNMIRYHDQLMERAVNTLGRVA